MCPCKYLAQQAVHKGFANPRHIDIDSTVQLADIQFPASVNLLVKTAVLGRRIRKILKGRVPELVKYSIPDINMKRIKGIANNIILRNVKN